MNPIHRDLLPMSPARIVSTLLLVVLATPGVASGANQARRDRDPCLDCSRRYVISVGERKPIAFPKRITFVSTSGTSTFDVLAKSDKELVLVGTGVGLNHPLVRFSDGTRASLHVEVKAGLEQSPFTAPRPSPGGCTPPSDVLAIRTKSLEVGEVVLFDCTDWRTFEIEDERIASVVAISPVQLQLNAKAAGKTRLSVCRAREFIQLDLVVSPKREKLAPERPPRPSQQ